MSSGTAREHVRVARALRDLPVIRARFAAGRLSYAKVRALTRIAAPATEAGLAELAGPMTANQLERFARAHRQVTPADDADARVRRRLAWRFEEDGSLSGTFRLPPLAGAVLLKALRAACADLAGDPPAGVSAETPAAADARPRTRRPRTPAAGQPAAALPRRSGRRRTWLTGWSRWRSRSWPGRSPGPMTRRSTRSWCTPAPTCSPGPPAPAADPGVSAETPPAPARVPGDPADPARCHVEDGPAISVSTAQMVACTAALSWMTHGDAGAVLALGRRRRRPSSAIRRAARERDHGRCRFPGCESRRTDLHHIQHWVNGGRTDLDNLISLCPWHHKVVHDRGYLIAAPRPAARSPSTARTARPLPSCPPLPEPDGSIDDSPRRGHHPGHDHPALVRRAPRPGPRHLGLLRQRPHHEEKQPTATRTTTPRPGAASRSTNRRTGPSGSASTRPGHPGASPRSWSRYRSELRCRSPLLGCAHA